MSRIALFVRHKENQRLLNEWLTTQNHEVVIDGIVSLDEPFDMAILDGTALDELWHDLQRKKDRDKPLFLPVLLITSRQDVRLVTRQMWQTVDELIFTPIEKVELLARIEIMRRARQMSLDLLAANAELEEANQQKLRFLAMISHELRTPLASIKGFSSTLLAEDLVWEPAQQREFIEIIDTESDKLTELIEQLLDLSRLQAGTLLVRFASASFSTVIDYAHTQLMTLTGRHHFVVDISPNLPVISLDIQRMAQVLTNLVGNAAKFAPENTDIVLKVYRFDDMLQVDIKDEGPGIPAGERATVFEAFRQLERKDEGQRKGAGLGLAICKALVETHGGRIWIQDREPPGTTVSFALPIAASAPVEVPSSA